MTMNKERFSYDGMGINDKNDEYAARVATFPSGMLQPDKDALGNLFAASPELLDALKNLVKSLPIVGLSLAVEKDIQSAIIAIRKAEGAK